MVDRKRMDSTKKNITPTAGVGSALAAGFITLMVAMGFGRFLYTPLLPLMQTEYGFRTEQAGLLASLNYVGYLAGAFTAGPLCHKLGEFRVLAAGLLLLCLTTGATGIFTDFTAVGATRLLAGTASALAFVSVSGLVLLMIARDGREHLAGIYYGGVGGGIIFTGAAALPVASTVGVGGTWLAFAMFSVVLAGTALLLLRGHAEPPHFESTPTKPPLPFHPPFFRLVIAYGLEGFGYIITGTFMVAAATVTVGPAGGNVAWMAAGCAALPSAFLWSTAARKWGRMKPLLVAFFLQAAGIALPAIVPGTNALIVGAVLFGGTFMGIVTLSLSEGASYAPAARARTVGFMTGIYGIGQIAGPALAGYFSARTGTYELALYVASAAVMAAGAILIPDIFTSRKSQERSDPCRT